jgi:hypothetical protein
VVIELEVYLEYSSDLFEVAISCLQRSKYYNIVRLKLIRRIRRKAIEGDLIGQTILHNLK